MAIYSRQMALASLLLATASGQQVIFIPANRLMMSPASASPHAGLPPVGRGLGAEPPCRQRRLEPFRQHVREQCRDDAATHCTVRREEEEPQRDLLRDSHNPMTPSSPYSMVTPTTSTLFDLSKEMDSFFDSLFAPPPSSRQKQQRSPMVEEEDPFESIFNSMLGFSLRAFDQMTVDVEHVANPAYSGSAAAAVVVEDVNRDYEEEGEGVEEVNEAEEEDAIPAPPSSSDDDLIFGLEEYPYEYPATPEDEVVYNRKRIISEKDVIDEEGGEKDAAIPTPEQAAENTLDVMVASLVQRFAEAAQQESSKDEAGTEEVGSPLFSVEALPQRLFQLGNNLLTETHTRRRLQEATQGKVDPHLQVKERLARRLTEYRTDLFYHPDGTLTMYTTQSMPSVFMSPHPSFMGGGAPSFESPLGMGSSHVDECMKSRFDNGDLEGICHKVVEQFFLAVEDRSMIPPVTRMEERRRSEEQEAQRIVQELIKTMPKKDPHEMSGGCALVLGAFFLSVALLLNKLSDSGEQYDDEESMDGGEFDYERIPEDEHNGLIDAVARGDARVFMGVPVQVV